MATDTPIEWTHFPGYKGKSWNPVTGCTKIAAGCKHCYAETLAKRFWKDRAFTDVQTHADRLDEPLRRRLKTCYFVNSMSDLFHEAVPFEFIAAVYGVMAACPQHLFIILTKRPKRMREFMAWASPTRCFDAAEAHKMPLYEKHALFVFGGGPWLLPNVIHGYSAANQADLDAGVGDLLATPSALRCLSLEPLIGPVYLQGNWISQKVARAIGGEAIDWVIVGGESGPGARPCDVAWIRSIVEQCKAAGVPCFVKQVGSNPVWHEDDEWVEGPLNGRYAVADRKGGNLDEWEPDLRVREFPTAINHENTKAQKGADHA